MTRYHINDDKEVVQCRSWLRSCKFKDYETESDAKEALLLQNTAEEYEAAKSSVREKFSNDNATRSFCMVDFSGMNKKKSLRNYVNELEAEFYSKGKSPDFFHCNSQLRQWNVSGNSSSQKVFVSRIPVADYEEAVITSKWSLRIEPAGVWNRDNHITYELDLHNDFKNEMIRAEHIVRETVIANMNGSQMPVNEIDKEAKFMVDQLGLAYSTIEELDTERGSFVSWNTAEGYGNFAKTDITNLLVNVNYPISSFNSRIFHDFIHTNPYYEARFPAPIDIRVFDNELGRSDNAWAIRYSNGVWKMFARIGEDKYVEEVQDPQHAYEVMRDFIKNNMLTNDDETVEEKAVYIRDLISGVNASLQSFIKWKEENPLY